MTPIPPSLRAVLRAAAARLISEIAQHGFTISQMESDAIGAGDLELYIQIVPRTGSTPNPAPANAPAPAPAAQDAFIPTPFQRGILAALNGQALRTDALGAAVGDRSRLYKRGGLKELRDRGLVAHHVRLGFYRPDALPPGLEP